MAGLFTLSMLATIGFIACFVIFPVDKIVYVFPFGHVSALNFALGLTLGVALFCIGAGAVHWARTLMSDEETGRRPARRSSRGRGTAREGPGGLRSRAPRSPASAAAS